MKTNERKKGISLIVLIIIILVMIILAAAIILNIDDTKIINKADKAVAENNLAVAKEIRVVAKAEWRANEAKLKKEGFGSFRAYLISKLEEAGLERTVAVTTSGDFVVIPAGFVASEATGENEISKGLVIYETTTPVTDENVETAQTSYNQYVWVPVPNMTEFVRKEWEKGIAITLTTSYNMDDATEAIEYTAMKESVAKYGGFYIARYEAGTNVERTDSSGSSDLYVQKNKSVYNFIKWVDLKDLCATLSTDTAVGHLIYGEEWDAALTFISKADADYATNSTNKGNYTESLLKTGANDAYAKNNIYDMAGNVWEWTQESYSDIRISRGGYYESYATVTPASYRLNSSTSYTYSICGFRLALYLK